MGKHLYATFGITEKNCDSWGHQNNSQGYNSYCRLSVKQAAGTCFQCEMKDI